MTVWERVEKWGDRVLSVAAFVLILSIAAVGISLFLRLAWGAWQ